MVSSNKVFHNRRKSKLEAQEALTGWLFILPTKWIGFSNYSKIFTDPMFLQCLYNTIFLEHILVAECGNKRLSKNAYIGWVAIFQVQC
ncbi:MAG: hypothetical protein PWP48_1235 [Clostridiales bacterium]|nr:hypothetical protein [Clostridiales bacterium]